MCLCVCALIVVYADRTWRRRIRRKPVNLSSRMLFSAPNGSSASPVTVAAAVRQAGTPTEAQFPFKRNRLRWQAANHGCHCFVRTFLLAGASFKRQPIGMLGRSNGNHDWLLANASACVSCGFRLRNARNASDCVWMENGLYCSSCSQECRNDLTTK